MNNDIKGLIVAATIVPTSSADTFPTHDEAYGKGGYRSVEKKQDLYSIPIERKKDGMLVFVTDDKSDSACTHEYRYDEANQEWANADKYKLMEPILSGLPNYSAVTAASDAL